MAQSHGLRSIVVLEDEELREAALEKGLVQEGDLVLTPGDENYEELANLPSINGVKVIGEKKSEDFGIEKTETSEFSTSDIINIWNSIMNE